MSQLNAMIVGAGKVAQEHAKAYAHHGVEVIGVTSRTVEGAQSFIDRLGLKAKAYGDLPNMILALHEASILSICSPPENHYDHILQGLRFGRHMAIEKPVLLYSNEYTDLICALRDLNKDGSIKTIVSFVLRWNSLVQNIKSRIKDIEPIIYAEVDYWHGSSHEKKKSIHEYGTREKPIDALIGGGCHAMDMIQYLVGSEIDDMKCFKPRIDEIAHSSVNILRFKNGVIGKVSAVDSVFAPYQFNIRILGENGMIDLNKIYAKNLTRPEIISSSVEVEELSESMTSYDIKYAQADNLWHTLAGEIPNSGAVWHHPFNGMIGELISAIKENRQTTCSLEDALKTHEWCL